MNTCGDWLPTAGLPAPSWLGIGVAGDCAIDSRPWWEWSQLAVGDDPRRVALVTLQPIDFAAANGAPTIVEVRCGLRAEAIESSQPTWRLAVRWQADVSRVASSLTTWWLQQRAAIDIGLLCLGSLAAPWTEPLGRLCQHVVVGVPQSDAWSAATTCRRVDRLRRAGVSVVGSCIIA